MEIDPNVAGDPTRSTVKSLCHEWTSTKDQAASVHASSDNTAALAILPQTLRRECVGACRFCVCHGSLCAAGERNRGREQNQTWRYERSGNTGSTADEPISMERHMKRTWLHYQQMVCRNKCNCSSLQALECDVVKKDYIFSYTELFLNSVWSLCMKQSNGK